MSDPKEQPQEYTSTYFVQDRENIEEMTRLDIQDKMLTEGQGGALPELADPSHLRRVLDVGCGTGEWLLETARTYPTIERLIGVDISGKMIEYARAKALDAGLAERVQFQMMDAQQTLEFPEASFDLVNQRFGHSWIRTWEWTKILLEYQRVCCLGGIIRITECEDTIESNSPALTKLWNLILETFYRSGRLFTQKSDGLTGELVRLMTEHGIQDVKSHLHTLVYAAGTQMGQYFYEDEVRFFRTALPFFQKWIRVPDDYQEIYEQALKEIQQPGFVATLKVLTVWGTRPDGKLPLM